MKTIHFVCFKFGRGGVGSVLKKLLFTLPDNKDLKISLITSVAEKEVVQLLVKDNDRFDVLFLDERRSRIFYLKKIMSNSSPEDIFVGVQGANTHKLAIAKTLALSRVKVIGWLHTSTMSALKFEKRRLYFFHFVMFYILSFFVKAYVCVSEGAAEEVRKVVRPGSKILVAKNPVFLKDSTLRKAPNCRSLGKKSEIVNFVSVGRLSREKGLDLALDAFERLPTCKWNYYIVGEGEMRKKLEEKVENSTKLKGKVFFLGHRSDVANILSEMDCLVLSSFFEGMPTVLVEASVLGIPLIASNCPSGPSEIIKHGENGFLFKSGCALDLTEKIESFLSNKTGLKNSIDYVSGYEARAATMNLIESIRDV